MLHQLGNGGIFHYPAADCLSADHDAVHLLAFGYQALLPKVVGKLVVGFRGRIRRNKEQILSLSFFHRVPPYGQLRYSVCRRNKKIALHALIVNNHTIAGFSGVIDYVIISLIFIKFSIVLSADSLSPRISPSSRKLPLPNELSTRRAIGRMFPVKWLLRNSS